MASFQRFVSYVEDFYVNGQPRHIASPETSRIAVLEASAYDSMSASEVQSLLATKHILIKGCPMPAISFDAKGLRTLANLDAPIDVQGKLDHFLPITYLADFPLNRPVN